MDGSVYSGDFIKIREYSEMLGLFSEKIKPDTLQITKTFVTDHKTFYALNIDKEKKMFSFIGLEPGNDTVLTSGKCKVF